MNQDIQYDPLFWDIETTSFDPMEPPAWENGTPNVILAVSMGKFGDGWREAQEMDQFEFDVETAVVSGVSGKDNRWDIFGAEHYLIKEVFGDGGIMMQMAGEIEDNGRDVFLTGWNTRNFDHSFVGGRCARHRLSAKPTLHHYKRLDMMRPAAKDYGNSHAVSEDDYLEYLGIENDDEFDGGDMWDEFQAGRLENIKSHALSDVTQMMEVFFTKRSLFYDHFYDHYDGLGESPIFGEVLDFD